MFSKGSSTVTLEDVMSTVSESQILNRYLGITEIPCVICSPLRKDTRPSFGFYANSDGRIFYKDFSTHESGGVIDLLSRMWGIPFQNVLSRIHDDMHGFSGDARITSVTGDGVSETESTVDIQVVTREWRDYDEEYWNSYGVSLDILKRCDVYPISRKIVVKNGVKYLFGADKHAYAFVERKDGRITLKIYQPFNKEYKWSSNIDRSVWSLWTRIPKKGKYLIISSSLKDCLNIWCNIHIPAICMQGEGYLPKPHIMDELKSRFREIIVFYDNDFRNPDNPGRKDSLDLCRTYGLERMEIPESYEAKDPSDLYRKYGKEKYMQIMKEIFINREHVEQENQKHQSQELQRD